MCKSGQILTFLDDTDLVKSTVHNILQISTIIPSLYTLGQDLKFLEPGARILRRLCGERRGSIRSNLQQCFNRSTQPSNRFRVQDTETSWCEYQGTPDDQVNHGIIQLWLFAGRHFPWMVPFCTRQEEVKQVPQTEEPLLWHRLASLALQLGFDNPEINRLGSTSPEHKIAEAALLQARKPPEYSYDSIKFDRFKNEIVHMFSHATESSPRATAQATLLPENGVEALPRRCGRVFHRAFQETREHCFLGLLADKAGDLCTDVSSLFVRIEVYKAFLGDLLNGAALKRGLQGESMSFSLSAIKSTSPTLKIEDPMDVDGIAVPDVLETATSVQQQDQGRSESKAETRLCILVEELRKQKSCNDQLLSQVTESNTRHVLLQKEKDELRSRLHRNEQKLEEAGR